ncbi:MAG: hypothetical protein ACRELB_03040 [Polyangiaceae bacterium]
MAKARGDQYPASETSIRTRRRRDSSSSDPNEAFVRAFVDALRDILQTENRISV